LTRPKSVNATWVSALGLAGFLGAVVYLGPERLPRPQFTLLCMLATAAPMIMADLLVRRVHRRHSTGLVWDRRAAGIDPGRVIVKLFGLVLTLACLAVVYWVVPEYQRKFFEPFWAALQLVGPWLVPVVIIYFGFVDARMEKPRDSYWILGALLFRRVRLADLDVEDRHELKHHALAWIIKGFYLPLMFVYLGQAIDGLAAWSLESVFTSIDRFAFFAIRLSLAVDLAFVVIGYSLMIRLIDAHTRTGNPFMYGWVFTMVLYQPFWASVGSRYFKLRLSLQQPDPPRDHHQRAVPFHQAPELPVQEHLLVVPGRAVPVRERAGGRREDQLDAARGQRALLHTLTRRRAASVRGPRLRAVRGVDQRARDLQRARSLVLVPALPAARERGQPPPWTGGGIGRVPSPSAALGVMTYSWAGARR
jgi:hypothetical protein